MAADVKLFCNDLGECSSGYGKMFKLVCDIYLSLNLVSFRRIWATAIPGETISRTLL